MTDGAPDLTIDVVVRDASAESLTGAYSICYVNGVQTQPGQDHRWREHADALLRTADGDPVLDPDWPDEHVLDPSTTEQREQILTVLAPVVIGCADAGFDAVEIDNLDTFTRFDQIDRDGALELARAYVDLAHKEGLAIAQKNAAEVATLARDQLGFDSPSPRSAPCVPSARPTPTPTASTCSRSSTRTRSPAPT